MRVSRLRAVLDLGQSLWLDFISRELLRSGMLARLIDEDGIRGLTSNPAIFEKAFASGHDYDEALREALNAGLREPQALFERAAIADIRAAADAFRATYEDTHARDGFVSLEVSPRLAHDAEQTIAQARRLWREVARDNLMIKVPGTPAGVIATRTLIGEGINVNVTLLFAREAYRAIAQAYIDGVETFIAAGGDASRLAGVASFFVSRIDSAMDAEIDARFAGADVAMRARLEALKGKVAIANARLAYQDGQALFLGSRWQSLAARGAQPQRLLWASTGTKNPAYRDTIYIEELIGADTVNTVPPATLDAFRDHGLAAARLTEELDGAQHVFNEIAALQLPFDAVLRKLVDDGVQLFIDADDKLLAAVAKRRDAM